jgi:benzoate-CoA ligase family protein
VTSPAFPERFNLARYFLFDRLAEGMGERVALRWGERSFTYQDVADRTRATSTLIRSAGVRRGERVLIVLPDTPPFAWAFFGALAAGAVVAMGNPDMPEKSLEYLVEYTGATAVITVPRVAAALARARDERGVGLGVLATWVVPDVPTGEDPEGPIVFDALDRTRDDTPTDAIVQAPTFESLTEALSHVTLHDEAITDTHRDEPAIWLFTSGSTGEPKANVHAHRDFAMNTEVYAKGTVGYRKDDVTVSVPRLYFGYATGTNLMFPFAVGATAALFGERPTPETLAKAIAAYRPTIVTNVPTMLGKLLDYDEKLRASGEQGLDLSSVRFSLSAGEALPEPLLRRWLARFGSDVYDGIGSAEMFHIYCTNRPGDVKPGSLGKAVAGYELRVLPADAEGPGAEPCKPGEIGVLWVRGDSVSMGYWLDRDKSFRTFFGPWCRTGDLFHMDADGYLYFAGRADDLLKVGGQWVSPTEVEECLMEHPAVAHAAVVGVEDDGLLKPKAFVVLRPGETGSDALASELQEHVKSRLAKHKYPRFVEFVADLPKNDRGKVDKKALRAQK